MAVVVGAAAAVIVFIGFGSIQIPRNIVVVLQPFNLGMVFLAQNAYLPNERTDSNLILETIDMRNCIHAQTSIRWIDRRSSNCVEIQRENICVCVCVYMCSTEKESRTHKSWRNYLQSDTFFVHISITPRQRRHRWLLRQFHLPNF